MIWTTRDGIHLDIIEMTKSHLYNCVAMLKRNALIHEQEMLAAYSYSGHGEQATYCAERAAEEAGDRVLRCEQAIRVMEEELEQRGEL